MKNIKIGLLVILGLAIVFGFFYWSNEITPPPPVEESDNQFIQNVNGKIKELSGVPESRFSQSLYAEIEYLINDYYTNDRLGSNPTENEQVKLNLTKSLYSTYVEKFVTQAYYVFNNLTWDPADLRFIKNESLSLRRSPLLAAQSQVERQLSEIQRIISQYEEIESFIRICKSFSYLETGLSDRFPIDIVTEKINSSLEINQSRFGNRYLFNCVRLNEDLGNIPEILFTAHVKYLDNKINNWSGAYINFNSQRTYADNVFIPISKEIETIDNDIYNSSRFNQEYLSLKRKWDSDAQKAYNHFNRPQ
ncbi:hypothetical protein [Mongoliitalea lutea]|uniref:Uncharacterized protein n=1 Tax=Mongoliitalea lutea TaxID=849756 RepID=A0A8J3G5E6_9BACT|nr:hypothetical protein [Mongoliitalea lutea]GHB36283.1 hypothetical protein GCM10008106_16960 [Mongoliitalea lutea]